MLLDLQQANLTACPKEVTIEQVKNREQAVIYATLLCEVFNFPRLFEHTINWLEQQIYAPQPSGYSFLAKVNGEVAGACSLMVDYHFKEFRAGGLYNACVAPKFRKYGVGTAMACHRVNIAKELGFDCLSIILMSDAMARGYCQRMGFTSYGTLTPYYVTP